MYKHNAICLTVFMLLCTLSASEADLTLVELGNFPVGNGEIIVSSRAEGVNDLGWVVGRSQTSGGRQLNWLYRDSQYVDLPRFGLPTIDSSRPSGINNNGWVLGQTVRGEEPINVWLWHSDGVVSQRFPLPEGADRTGLVYGNTLNNRNEVLLQIIDETIEGSILIDRRIDTVLWRDTNGDGKPQVSEYIYIQPSSSDVELLAVALNDNSEIAGTETDSEGVIRPFIWSETNGMRFLDFGGRLSAEPILKTVIFGLNNQGILYGNIRTSENQFFFIYDITSDILSHTGMSEIDLNNAGYLVGRVSDRLVLQSPNGELLTLDDYFPSNISLNIINGFSDNNQICGTFSSWVLNNEKLENRPYQAYALLSDIEQTTNPLQAKLSVNSSSGYAPLTVVADALQSTVGEGRSIENQYWFIGDEIRPSVQVNNTTQLRYTFDIPGSHDIALAIVDSAGEVSITSQEIIVEAPPLPSPWQKKDLTDGTWAVDVVPINDSMLVSSYGGATFVYQAIEGDAVIEAQLSSYWDPRNAGDNPGFMIRGGLEDDALYSSCVLSTFTASQSLITRSGNGSGNDSYESYFVDLQDGFLRLVRSGNTITYLWSYDGQSYQEIHRETLALPQRVLLGLYAFSNGGTRDFAVFDHIHMSTTSPNQPPLAGMTVTPTGGLVPVMVEIQSHHSDPNLEDTLTVSWDLGDGTVLSGPGPISHTYTETGPYLIRQTVTDAAGLQAIAMETIQVLGPEDNQAPSIAVTLSTTGLEVAATADGSDPEDDNLEYQWDFGDGTSFPFSNQTAVMHQYTQSGTYTVKVQVRDTALNIAAVQQQVTVVQPQNLPDPWIHNDIGNVSVAGSAQFDAETQSFTLSGNGYAAWPNNGFGHAGYQPIEGDFSVQVRLTSLSEPPEKFDPLSAAGLRIGDSPEMETHLFAIYQQLGRAFLYGTYQESGLYATRRDPGNVQSNRVNNSSGQPIWFKIEREGQVLRSYWSSNGTGWELVATTDGNDPEQWDTPFPQILTVSMFVAGKYDLSIAAFDQVEITGAQPPNRAPIITRSPQVNPQSISVGQTVTLDLQAEDLDGDPITVTWDFGDGSSATGFSVRHVYSNAGVRTVTATVSDGSLATSEQIIIEVNQPPVNNPPIIVQAATVSDNESEVGIPLQFTVAATDPDNHLLTYTWQFGDGQFAQGPSVQHIYTSPGIYSATVIVSDGRSPVTSHTGSITITESSGNRPPVVQTSSFEVAESAFTRTVLGTVAATDPDGDAMVFAISDDSTDFIIDAQSGQVMVSPQANLDFEGNPGPITLMISVSDAEFTTSGSVSITISDSPEAPEVANDSASTLRNRAIDIDVIANDSDPDGDDTPSVGWFDGSSVEGGQITLTEEGTLRYVPPQDYIGTDSFSYRATDLTGSESPLAYVSIMVTATNTAPQVDAGLDQTVSLPTSILSLSGSATDDGLPGGALTYTWSGPYEVTFGDASSPTSTVSWNAAGSYELTLTVSDGELSQSDTMTLIVMPLPPVNTAPVVDAGLDQTVTLPTNTLNLAGSATDDGLPSGTLTYSWSGPSGVVFSDASSATSMVSWSTAGTYELTLTVSDGELSQSDTMTLIVMPLPPVNTAPVVDAGLDQTVTLPTNTLNLAGSATDDGLPNGTLTYSWSGPSGVVFSDASSATSMVTWSAAGSYELTLTVSDGELSRSDSMTLTVAPSPPVNTPPVVDAGLDQTITLPNNTLSLVGSASDDGLPANSSLVYQWSGPSGVNFTDANAAATLVTVAAPGVYTLTLSVSDGDLTTTDTVVVTVAAAVPQPPMLEISSVMMSLRGSVGASTTSMTVNGEAVTITDGQFVITVPATQQTLVITITADGVTSTQEVTITPNPASDG